METDEIAQCLGSISSDEENIELSEEVANLLGIKVVDPVRKNPEPAPKQTRKPGRPPRDYTNVYPCTKCNKKYNTPSKLSTHSLTHNPAASYFCDQCGLSFKQKSTLLVHARKHSVSEYSVCEYCEYKTYDKSTLYRHTLVHRNERRFVCEVCGARFNADNYLRQHKEDVHAHSKQYSCTMCPYKSFSATSVHSHTRNVHTEEGKYECNVCSKLLKTKTTFLVHYKLHLPTTDTQVTCTLCSKTFNNSKLLSQHKKQKHLEKRFSCSLCSKKFAFSGKLSLHELTHTKLKPFSCPHCTHTCNKRDNLNKHIARMHNAQDDGVIAPGVDQIVEVEAVTFVASLHDAVASEVVLGQV